MDNTFKEALGSALCKNVLNEASFSTDIASWEPLIFPLIKKIYPESLVEQIASVQPTKSPVAKISYLNAIYTGNNSNNQNDIHWTNSRLITLPVSSQASIVVGNTYVINTTPSVSAKVFYGEVTYEFITTESGTAGLSQVTSVSAVPKYWNILVANIDTSNLTTSNTINSINASGATNTIGGQTILYSTTNKNTIKKVFKDYSNTLENNSNLYEVNFETATKTIPTNSRKIRSRFSQERLQDLKALYDEKAYDIVAEAIANEVRQEIDREVITYLKKISTPMKTDINLPLSLGMQSGLDAITYDLYASIMLAGEEIIKATKRNRTMFVLADSATCAFLLVNPFHAQTTTEDSNPYLVGKIGAYDLFCDPYSTEHYIIVGYNFKSKDRHDSGLYFTPYTTTIHETTATDTNSVIPFSQNFMVMNRYGFTNHPQDSGTGDGDSDFFRIFSVNFYFNGVTVPNFPEQFRTSM